jgi:hypothetical protein
MNRVTRFSSAAFGMLLLAGLAWYQGHEDPTSGAHGSLVGTALAEKPEQKNIDCKDHAGPDEQANEICAGKGQPN